MAKFTARVVLPTPRLKLDSHDQRFRNARSFAWPESSQKIYCRDSALRVRSEEDRRSEYSLEGSDETPILRTALLHPEDIEHLGCATKGNCLLLLSNSERGQENGNQPILAPRYSIRSDGR